MSPPASAARPQSAPSPADTAEWLSSLGYDPSAWDLNRPQHEIVAEILGVMKSNPTYTTPNGSRLDPRTGDLVRNADNTPVIFPVQTDPTKDTTKPAATPDTDRNPTTEDPTVPDPSPPAETPAGTPAPYTPRTEPNFDYITGSGIFTGARGNIYGEYLPEVAQAGLYQTGAADRAAAQQFYQRAGDAQAGLLNLGNTTGPSAAQGFLSAAADRASRQALSNANSIQGLSPAQRARLAQSGAAQAMADIAGQGAMLRAQEQQTDLARRGQAYTGAQSGAQIGGDIRNQVRGDTGLQVDAARYGGTLDMTGQDIMNRQIALGEMGRYGALNDAANRAAQLQMAQEGNATARDVANIQNPNNPFFNFLGAAGSAAAQFLPALLQGPQSNYNVNSTPPGSGYGGTLPGMNIPVMW